MRAPACSRAEIVATGCALSATVVFLLWLVLHIGGGTGVRYFDDIGTALAALTACVACILAGRRQSGAERRFWVMLGLALAAWSFAEVTWGFYDLALKVAVPVPSWADVGYLGQSPSRRPPCSAIPACAPREVSRRERPSTVSSSELRCSC